MEEPIRYYKQKWIYTLQDAGRGEMLAFGNIKALCRYVSEHDLWPGDIEALYNRMVLVLRGRKAYQLVAGGITWYITAVKVVGQKVRSAKRPASVK